MWNIIGAFGLMDESIRNHPNLSPDQSVWFESWIKPICRQTILSSPPGYHIFMDALAPEK